MLSMYVTILRYKSLHNARVSRNLPEQIMKFFKDHFSQHEVTGKSTHGLQSYNNPVMPEIKVCFTPAAVHRHYESRPGLIGLWTKIIGVKTIKLPAVIPLRFSMIRACVVGMLAYVCACDGGYFIFHSHSCIIDDHVCSRVKVKK